MAALLKKRALAEYSQVIQEAPKPPPLKKLRLIHKAKVVEPHLELHAAATSHEALQALLHFEEALPLSAEHVEPIIRAMLDHWYKEKEAAVRAKIASLLGDLVKTPGFGSNHLVEEFSALLQQEGSHKVVSQLIASFCVLGRSQPRNSRLHQQLTDIAKQRLSDSSHLVRSKCLELIGWLGSPEMRRPDEDQSENWKSQQTLLTEYTNDVDSRVRTSAFQAMVVWQQRGIRLDQGVYASVCRALSDDHEGVRLAATRLVWVLSHLYPESLVPVAEAEDEIRLVDDGFARICNMVNDLSMRVRAEAAGLLGSLHLVSPRFLEQTLDKKLMSNMRRKCTAHDRQRELFSSGAWSSGKKWGDDAPKEEVNPDNVSLISTGACGAFVHGLEDEYMEVRNAAIDSLCELASQSASFASQVQDFLVDMFNDEIEGVRLNAINSLRKIGHHLVLREDQLEIILGVLKDFSFEIRQSVHDMFMATRLGTKACLQTCVLSLLDNLKNYPQDRPSIWKCMQRLGQNHPSLALPLVPELLSTHPYLDTPEPDMEDPAYMAILLLMFNAAEHSSTLLPVLPDHTLKHYAFMRDTLPDLVPVLKLPNQGPSQILSPKRPRISSSGFLQHSLHRLEGLDLAQDRLAQDLIQITIRDLERVSEVEPELAATAECVSMYLQCQLCLAITAGGSPWACPAILSIQQSSLATNMTDKVMTLTAHLENLFVGLSAQDLSWIRQTRLRAQALQLLRQLHIASADSKPACIRFLRALTELKRFLEVNQLEAVGFTSAFLAEMHKLETLEPSVYVGVLQMVMKDCRGTPLRLDSQVRRARVEIIEPTSSSDNPLKFTAGLTVATTLIANIENVENVQNVRIKLKYPDQESQMIVPRATDFRQLNPLHKRLVTQVLMSHAIWSEPCHVEVSLVLCYNPDRDIEGDKVAEHRADCTTVLDLCKPIQVHIAPKAVKR